MNQAIHCSCGEVFSKIEDARGHIDTVGRANPDAHTVINESEAADLKAFALISDALAGPANSAAARQAIPVRDLRLPIVLQEIVAARTEIIRHGAAMEAAIVATEAARGRYEAARGRLETADRELEALLRERVAGTAAGTVGVAGPGITSARGDFILHGGSKIEVVIQGPGRPDRPVTGCSCGRVFRATEDFARCPVTGAVHLGPLVIVGYEP